MIARSRGGFLVLAVVCGLGGVAAVRCNYNAAVVVNIPQWKPDERAVVFLGARPTAACDGDPAKLRLAFLLRNERGDGIEDGDRVRIASAAPAAQTLVLTTTGAPPTLAAAGVAVTLGDAALGADGGAGDADGGVGALPAQVTAIRYVPFTSGGRTDRRDPIAGALVFDNGYDVQADDAEGVRIDGATELAEHALCFALGPDRCRFGAVAFELYDLADSNVAQLAPFLSDPAAMRTKLDLLRDAARASGDGPVYDGLVKAAPEVRQQAATLGAGAAAAVVLVTKDGRSESHATFEDTLAQVPGSPVFIITRQGTPELRRIACASGGVMRVVGAAADYATAFAEVRDALRGRFEVDVDVPGLAAAAPGAYQLAGTLGVTVGGVTASAPLSLAITKPGP